jgi:hypothetical protein
MLEIRTGTAMAFCLRDAINRAWLPANAERYFAILRPH